MAIDWPPPKDKWFPGFTATRDGWVRWHKQTVFCGGKLATRKEVEDTFIAKRKLIDAPVEAVIVPGQQTYRDVLSEFLSIQKSRVDAKKNSIRERTYFNYVTELNRFGGFVHKGQKVADMLVGDIGPEQFTAYAALHAKWSESGFDSVVCRVGSLFRFAVEMEYIDRYRPGPTFRRPAKKDVRDQRIDAKFSMDVEDIAKTYLAAPLVGQCWIALGMCAAFNNSDVANITSELMDLKTGIIDYRRRKTGKVRRVVPLPKDVIDLLKSYRRPAAADPVYESYFFLSENGLPYSRTRNSKGKPSCSISRLTARWMADAGVKRKGVNFKSFRTSFYNLAPGGAWDTERKIIMGRAQGTIDFDSYMEGDRIERLKFVVDHVWNQVKVAIEKLNTSRRDASRE